MRACNFHHANAFRLPSAGVKSRYLSAAGAAAQVQVPFSVQQPVAAPEPRRKNTILHLGLGAFQRAHQTYYLQKLLDLEDRASKDYKPWVMAGARIRDDTHGQSLINALINQNGRYTLESITPDGRHSYMMINAMPEVVPWTPQLDGVINVGKHEDTKVISFTVTEGGYYFGQGQKLDMNHPEIIADLESHNLTIYGALTAILKARIENIKSSDARVTLLSCDNVLSNGHKFRSAFLEFLDAKGDRVLFDWVKENTSCPNSMVDRITPRPTEEVIARVEKATGIIDPCAVMAEEFSQWVIEDNFINGRPDLEKVGVSFVEDVHPYEEAKIRILNASHGPIAWAGTLKGFTYIHQGALDADISALVKRYVKENVIPCLVPSPIDLENYMNTVVNRFSNAALMDTNQRVASDSFSKIPGFILPTLKARLKRGESIEATTDVLAAYFLFLKALHENRIPYLYNDSAFTPHVLKQMMTSDDPVSAYANETALWLDIAGNEHLEKHLKRSVSALAKWT